MKKDYYYIDVNIESKAVVDWGTSSNATHTGATEDPNIHRAYLTKGQFNKLVKLLN